MKRIGGLGAALGGLGLGVMLAQSAAAFDCKNVSDVSYKQCVAMNSLANTTGVHTWRNNSGGWADPTDTTVCDAHGVYCSGDGTEVRYMYLYSNNLVGGLPDNLDDLEFLLEVSFSANKLSGPLPSSIGNMSRLQTLALNYNALSGSLPASIGRLTELRALDISNNHFSGVFPDSLVNLTNLAEDGLALQNNCIEPADDSMRQFLNAHTTESTNYFVQNCDAVPLQARPNRGRLEIPADKSSQSGIGLVSGWHCDAPQKQIAVSINGSDLINISSGSSRRDTLSICNDSNNGYGLLWNYSLLGEGRNLIVAYVDGLEFDRSYFDVAKINGQAFLRGASGVYVLPDFPEVGQQVEISWDEASQKFVVINSGTTDDPTFGL